VTTSPAAAAAAVDDDDDNTSTKTNETRSTTNRVYCATRVMKCSSRSLSHVDIVITHSDADDCSHPNDASPEYKKYLTIPGILLGLLDPKSVPKHRYITTNKHCVTSQKSEYLRKYLFPRGGAL
jgi:hypothetical protein